jgi:phosphatidylglycerophosphatase C
MKAIAFFDLDGTVTTKDTMLEFIKFAKGTPRFIAGFLVSSPYMIAYKLNPNLNQWAKEKLMRHFFKNTSLAEFQKLGDAFATSVLPKLIRPKAAAEIQKLQHSGATVVIVSAAFNNWIQKWIEQNNLQLLASIPEVRDGKITGRIEGKNCHGAEKVKRIKKAYQLDQYDTILAYGDSKGDKPMLALATQAFFKPFRD